MAQCGTAEAGARGIVLRRVHATAQDVAIVPLQRIGAGQAVIAGQRQGILDRGDGVIGDGQLDDVGLGRGKRDTVIEITGKGCDQPCIDDEPRLDRAKDLLRPRQVASGAPKLAGTRCFRNPTSQSRAARATPS